ncbi:MAG: HAD family hydrolase [Candidatus Nanohaloarchaea archaeon]
MTRPVCAVDFAGTLLDPAVIEAADAFRAEVLGREEVGDADYADDTHFAENRRRVADLTGVMADMTVTVREGERTRTLTGEQYQNTVSSDLFRTGVLRATRRRDGDVFVDGMPDALTAVQDAGYRLIIVSTARTDIISAVLQVAGCPATFDRIVGQSPELGGGKEELMREAAHHGSVRCVVGDSMPDIAAGHAVGARTVFVSWGHASGGEEDAADRTVAEPVELPDAVGEP